jgi:lysophospholipase L1-like esterase
MKTLSLLAAPLLVLALTAAAKPAPPQSAPRVILVGDSTVQPASGYGEKLCARFKPEVVCRNTARGGRSTKSFRFEGRWSGVIAAAKDAAANHQPTYVLIQFGHNDASELPERHTDMDQFIDNYRTFVREVRAAGATPVLVTPLTRRQFKDGKLTPGDVGPRAEAIRQVAKQDKVPLLDLYADSQAAVQKMGPSESDTLAQAPPPPEVVAGSLKGQSVTPNPQTVTPAFDYTHIGEKGAQVFSAVVADEIKKEVPALGRWLR